MRREVKGEQKLTQQRGDPGSTILLTKGTGAARPDRPPPPAPVSLTKINFLLLVIDEAFLLEELKTKAPEAGVS